jgi:DNA-binding GntR family transcriptional regulator
VAVRQLDTVSLREQALSTIRSWIVLGQIKPGVVYSAPSIALQLGVSATPVREAMSELIAEGVATAVRNKGFRIVEITDHDLDEIFQLRVLLEAPTGSALAGTLDDATVATLRGAIGAMRAASAGRDLTAYLDADRTFHLTLLGRHGNGRLVQIVDRLREHTRLYGLPGLLGGADGAQATLIDEHEQILGALVAGDSAKVEELMKSHLGHTRGIWVGVREERAAT